MDETGRKAKITSIGFTQRPLDEFISVIDDEAQRSCDLILLPEACTGNDIIEPLDGRSVKRVSEIAASRGVYIVFPIYRNSKTEERINSSILIGRKGEICGVYDKVYPFWSEFDLDPVCDAGRQAPVFETDFGKVGMAICFDANFPEVFKRLSLGGAEIVLWSSAYSAGMSLQAHAINYNYTIITSTLVPDCLVYDITGQEIYYQYTPGGINISRVTVDLDRCAFHQNYNMEKRDKLLNDYAGKIESDLWLEREQWFTLRAVVPGISAKKLAAEYGMEELTAYKNRSLIEIDKMRGFKFSN